MSYLNGEEAIIARLVSLGYWTTDNVDNNDWGLLDSGNNSYYAIAKPGPGPAPIEFITPLQYVITWQTILECWRQYVDDGTTAEALFNDVSSAIGIINSTRNLGLSYVENVRVASVSPPIFRWNKDGGPAWLVQEINIEWLEEITTTYS